MSPNLYLMLRSASANLSVNGSLIWVNCWYGPSLTAGRVVVKGLARMLYASARFQPSVFSSWYKRRGVMDRSEFGCIRSAHLAPARSAGFTFDVIFMMVC